MKNIQEQMEHETRNRRDPIERVYPYKPYLRRGKYPSDPQRPIDPDPRSPPTKNEWRRAPCSRRPQPSCSCLLSSRSQLNEARPPTSIKPQSPKRETNKTSERDVQVETPKGFSEIEPLFFAATQLEGGEISFKAPWSSPPVRPRPTSRARFPGQGPRTQKKSTPPPRPQHPSELPPNPP